ncbi:fimbrial biogenesis outer membrane usher protein [Aurantiacibacter arachoides]|uniref:fimbrial biogenesis outer membrane usher protein n=1 Tax=Aurantiacibacter arachoides TaxID=1850444 RepID=UPI00103F14DD|nr:fimbrial biogenesis outer membrane usher protein [Aurantiacibacter arachoides]
MARAFSQEPGRSIEPVADQQDRPTTNPEQESTTADRQPVVAESVDADALFRQIFGTDRPVTAAGIYAVQVDQIYVGDFAIDPGNGGGTIDPQLLRTALIPVAVGDTKVALEQLATQDSVGFDDLRALDFEVVFDPGRLALQIAIPPERRNARDLALRTARSRAELDYVDQADISAYLSARAGIDVIEQSSFADTGLGGLAADIDAGFNIGGVALQARFRYDERRNFSRQDVRLTYDDTENLIRYELGDLSVGRRPFQLAPRIAGIAAFREFPIDPYRNIRPTPEQGFQLDEPARVEVILNGAPVRTYDLNSGRYNLRDFPLIPSAANDIELRITYASGRTEVLVYPAFFDIELLDPGLVDFALNAGVSYRDDGGRRIYDTGDYNVIGYVRRGFTDTLTAGLSWEGNRHFDTVGAEAVWASSFGSFAFNASTNIRDPGFDTSRFAVQYAWRDTDSVRGRAIDAQAILTGSRYRTLNQLFGGNVISVSAQARAGQMIGQRLRATIYGGYEDAREFGERYYGGLSASYQLPFGALSLGAEYQGGTNADGAIFRLAYSMPLGPGTATASYTTQDNAFRADYTRLTALGVGSVGLSGGIERRDDFDRQFIRANYIGNRFEGTLEQVRVHGSNGLDDIRTVVNFGTALYMADGMFGIGRPISNSFALVDIDERAGDYQIAVEPRRGFGSTETYYTAYSGALGPAVVPTLPPYFDRSLQVDAPDAPAGTSLGGQVFALRPGYRSGYALKVGSAANVSLVGTLTFADGSPLAFFTGSVRSSDGNDDNDAAQVFTNAAGRFFLDGLVAGESYVLTFPGQSISEGTILAVPEDALGIVRLDDPVATRLMPHEEGEER